jgi:hypothetical protein
MSEGPFYAMPISDDDENGPHQIHGSGDVAVSKHAPTTRDAALYLAAHMNHAWREGKRAGAEERARQIRELIGARVAR